MGRYMIVVLKPQYHNDTEIEKLNKQLEKEYGAGTDHVFNTWRYLGEEAEFLNHDPAGLKQIPDWKRPIKPEVLHSNFFWMRVGELHIKLSACSDLPEASNAVAVCKWILKTKGQYIEKAQCANHSKKVVAEYLNPLFMEHGYNLTRLWKQH